MTQHRNEPDAGGPPHRPRVVIVGAGFGGLNAAQALSRAPLQVTIVDRYNHHLFQPLLYQVATAGLSPSDIAYPIRGIFRRQRNVHVLLAEAVAVKTGDRRVILEDGEVPYDYLILATGSRHAYFGHPEWERFAPGLKSVDDALEIRRRLLLAFEKAERETDPARRQALLTFVVVGGGPTGVELAGAIAEIAFQVMTEDFRSIDPCDARIVIVEAGPRILAGFPAELSDKAEASLRALGVEVTKNAPVIDVGPDHVVAGGQSLFAATILWAAGVIASPLAGSLGLPLDRFGRVTVEPDLSLPGLPGHFVIGDLAAFPHQTGEPLPGLAPVAIQQGRHAAANVMRLHRGEATRPFHYKDRGIMATIGRAHAVADLKFMKISGWPAWVAWTFIHILFLIGFRNRLMVLLNWAWSYLTTQRSARLITGGAQERPVRDDVCAGPRAGR